MILEVHREGDDGPGVLPVVLAVSPSALDRDALAGLQPGRAVLVVGRLEVDVDYARKGPIAHQSVVVHRIELLPPEGDLRPVRARSGLYRS